METIDRLSEETGKLAEMICQGEVLDDPWDYDRQFDEDPVGYDTIHSHLYEEYDSEMYYIYHH
jgi:hypothetical protein